MAKRFRAPRRRRTREWRGRRQPRHSPSRRVVAPTTAFYSTTTITGNAGEVIEILVKNTGSVVHNLRVSGLDKEFDNDDDFEPQPLAIQPGKIGRLLVKIDQPDTYPFRCDFHPALQTGQLVLQ